MPSMMIIDELFFTKEVIVISAHPAVNHNRWMVFESYLYLNIRKNGYIIPEKDRYRLNNTGFRLYVLCLYCKNKRVFCEFIDTINAMNISYQQLVEIFNYRFVFTGELKSFSYLW
jgi:hypothetical protein